MLPVNPSLKYYGPIYMDGRLFLSENLEEFEEENCKFTNIFWGHQDKEIEVLQVPSHVELCDNCDGVGKHLLTSLRNITFSRDDEDPDFFEDMQEGRFDQTCNSCKGTGRIITIDEEVCDKTILEIIHNHFRFVADCRAEEEAERRMGC